MTIARYEEHMLHFFMLFYERSHRLHDCTDIDENTIYSV